MALTSDDVNYMVMRYMQESGFVHSAFAFGCESHVSEIDVDGEEIAPGALIKVIQKGIQYMELEANLTSDCKKVDGEFSMLSALEILRAKDTDALRGLVRSHKEENEDSDDDKPAGGDQPVAMEEDHQPVVVNPEAVRTLQGHQGEVFAVQWSPTRNQLVSTSGDSTGRLWDLTAEDPSLAVLPHMNGRDDTQKDVTTTDWSPDGRFVATGAYDGIARIWGKDGRLHQLLEGHSGPVFSLKYSKNGAMLLSGSVDKSVIVWDTRLGEIKQNIAAHDGAVLDVCWRNNTSFATCSTDKFIHVYKLDKDQPTRKLVGHSGEVNCVTWAPSGKLLASCSDDCSAKIWSLPSDSPMVNLKDPGLGRYSQLSHELEIYTTRFRPAGQGSENPNQELLLATGSFDHKIKIWSCDTGSIIHTLAHHTKAVYSINWSPNAKLLATGAFDKTVLIWDLDSAQVVKSFGCSGGVFEVSWNVDGNRLAVGTAGHKVHVLDMRM